MANFKARGLNFRNLLVAIGVFAFAIFCSLQTDHVKPAEACSLCGVSGKLAFAEGSNGFNVPLHGSATFHVKIDSSHNVPSQEVDVDVSSSDTQQFTVDKSTLVFTTQNYNTYQTITLTAANSASQGDVSTDFSLTSNDSHFSGTGNVLTFLYEPGAIAATDLLGQLNQDGTPNFFGSAGGKHTLPDKGTLGNATGMAVDSVSHRLFVADTGNNRVVEYNLDTNNHLIDHYADFELGQPAVDGSQEFKTRDPSISRTGLSTPVALAYDGDRNLLFVADYDNHRVMVYNVATTGSTDSDHLQNAENASYVIGQSEWDDSAPTFTTEQFDQSSVWDPHALALAKDPNDSSKVRLFVTDDGLDRIMAFDVSTSVLDQCAAVDAIQGSDTNPKCTIPYQGHVKLMADNVLNKSSFFDSTIYSPDQSHLAVGAGGLAYDPVDQYLYVSDDNSSRVLVFNVALGSINDGEAAGNVIGQVDFGGTNQNRGSTAAANTLSNPLGISVDPTQRKLYIADWDNGRVLVYDISNISNESVGTQQAVQAVGQNNYSENIQALGSNRFVAPSGVAIDPSTQRLYVADTDASRVMIFDLLNTGNDTQETLMQSNNYTQQIDASNAMGTVSFSISTMETTEDMDFNLNNRGQLKFHDFGGNPFSDDTATLKTRTTDTVGAGAFYYDQNHVITFTPADDGVYMADDVIGQDDYTSSDANHGLPQDSVDDLSLSSVLDVKMDKINHRLFVADTKNNRVVVFNLNSHNELVDKHADFVLGQPDLVTPAAKNDPAQDNMNFPLSLAYDESRNLLFLADASNNRVLVYDVAVNGTTPYDHLENGEKAKYVIGQTDWITGDSSKSDDNKFYFPTGLALDTSDSTNPKLFVTDSKNGFVKVYNVSTSNLDACATTVVITGAHGSDANANCNVDGQTVDLKTKYILGNGQDTQSSLAAPVGLAFDPSTHFLFVSDNNNNRVMVFDVAATGSNDHDHLQNSEKAFSVLGQADFDSLYPNRNSTDGSVQPTANTLRYPGMLFVDSDGQKLYVTDSNLTNSGQYSFGNGRIMVFDISGMTLQNPLRGMDAVAEIGHTNFATMGSAVSRSGLGTGAGMYLNSDDQKLYVADDAANRILVFDLLLNSRTKLPDGTVGVAYDAAGSEPEITNGTIKDGVTTSLTFGKNKDLTHLPDGLTFNQNNGELEGTPNESGSFDLYMQTLFNVGDSGSFIDHKHYTLMVEAAATSDNQTNPVNQGGGVPVAFLLSSNPGNSGTSSGNAQHAAASENFCDHSVPDANTGDAYISALYSNCVINTQTMPSFTPDTYISRAEAVSMAVNLMGKQLVEFFYSFRDVDAGYKYAVEIATAAKNNLVEGYKTDDLMPEFRPYGLITRAEALKVILLAKLAQVPAATSNHFSDVQPGDWYYNVANYAYENGIVQGFDNGDGTVSFKPNHPVTKEAMAKMIYNTFELK